MVLINKERWFIEARQIFTFLNEANLCWIETAARLHMWFVLMR